MQKISRIVSKHQTFFSVCKIETCTCRKNLDAVRQSGNHRTVIF